MGIIDTLESKLYSGKHSRLNHKIWDSLILNPRDGMGTAEGLKLEGDSKVFVLGVGGNLFDFGLSDIAGKWFLDVP